MELSPIALMLIGLLLAVWTAAAAWMMIKASDRIRGADAARMAARRMGRMLEEAPAIALLVRSDGRIEGSDRLADWLGLSKMPGYLSELAGHDKGGLTENQIEQLTSLVRRTQKTAAPFRLSLTPIGTGRSIAVRGALADPVVSPSGAALLWVFDFTESQDELVNLRNEAERARADFAALVGLIEAAPMPMWFREQDGRLRLVNQAYVNAVGVADANTVVAEQIELVEPVNGVSASDTARQAADKGSAIERRVTTTIEGARRSLRVTDLPLGREGIAGYAVDIEEMEELSRQFRAFREAQRSMLDHLSIGVALFDANRRMTFANQPFHRVFELAPGIVVEGTNFEQFLAAARDKARIPTVQDFLQWRRELGQWFRSDEPVEEEWPLPDGTHLRVVVQPMPDGGLVLFAEDRTEQLAASAMRDTLLRTRSATFDNLYEALAVFAPDGHLELWNRGFPSVWGVDETLLERHPAAADLLDAIAANLQNSEQAKTIGNVIRAATLDRKNRDGKAFMNDGRCLSFAGVPLPDGNGLLTVLDITASVEAENALRERNKALEEADALTTRFLANMSYEFRTPLTSITGFTELLSSGTAGELSDPAKEYVEAIADAARRLTEQVENVLDMSQSEAGQLPVSLANIDLLPFLTELVRSREADIREANLSLSLRGDPDNWVQADPQQLGRAIANIVQNAIEATPAGGKILIDLKQRKDSARIVISDNGRGMGHEALSRALEGLQASNQGAGSTRRSGLGIPLARQLISAQGGTVEYLSRPNGGTTVTIKLPRIAA